MKDYKILVADDDRMLRALLSAILKKHEVLQASDGRSALEMAEQERPDLVILDRNMPYLNGMEVLRALRASPSLADIQVIILSAFDKLEDQVQGLQAGADAYLSKADLAAKLPGLVDELLEKSNQG